MAFCIYLKFSTLCFSHCPHFQPHQPFETTRIWLKIPKDSVFAEHPVVFTLILILSLMYFSAIRVESLRGAQNQRRSRDRDERAEAQRLAPIKPQEIQRVSCDTSSHCKTPREQPQSIIKSCPFLIAKSIPQQLQSPHVWHLGQPCNLPFSLKKEAFS